MKKCTRRLLIPVCLLTLFTASCTTRTERNITSTTTPDWYQGYPLYEVYVRAFSDEGTLNALRTALPRLKTLGISNLWLMPIHPTGEVGRKGNYGSPYSVKDYFAVGKEYGTVDDLKNLVADAHQKGMHVMLDMVLNHSANDHILMKEHPDWYAQDSLGNFTREVADWSDITDWNFNQPEVKDYLAGVMLHYIKDIDMDGFRCDVAGMVPHEFWQRAIPELRTIKPNIFMLAEWGDPDMIKDGFDAIYDWDLYHRMKDHHSGKITLDSLWSVIEKQDSSLASGGFWLRFVENHDEPRSAEVFGLPGVKPYAVLIFTLPGVPLIYNGQETGATHKPSLFEQEPIYWPQDSAEVIWNFYTDLIAIRNNRVSLRQGRAERLQNDFEDILAFRRIWESDTTNVAINFADAPSPELEIGGATIQLDAYGYLVW